MTIEEEVPLTISELSTFERRFERLVNAAGDGILVTDVGERITFVNATAERMFLLDSGALVGTKIAQLLPFLDGGRTSGLVRCRDGHLLTVEVTVASFEYPAGEIHHVFVARDLSERRQLDDLDDLANRDPLTGLWNRRHLVRELRSRLAASLRYGTKGALLLIEIEQLAALVHSFGHEGADQLLQTVAVLVQRSIRESDLAARMTGSKLGVLLDQTAAHGAERCAEKIVRLVHELALPGGGMMSVAIGIASFAERAQTVEDVVHAASIALSRAKDAPGLRVYSFRHPLGAEPSPTAN